MVSLREVIKGIRLSISLFKSFSFKGTLRKNSLLFAGLIILIFIFFSSGRIDIFLDCKRISKELKTSDKFSNWLKNLFIFDNSSKLKYILNSFLGNKFSFSIRKNINFSLFDNFNLNLSLLSSISNIFVLVNVIPELSFAVGGVDIFINFI